MKKRVISTALILAFLLTLCYMAGFVSAVAAGNITALSGTDTYSHTLTFKLNSPSMTVDGKTAQIDANNPGVCPYAVNGRTLVPIRAVIETMGGTVNWTASSKQIDILKGDIKITMWLDNTRAVVNGQNVTLDVPPTANEGRTMVPLRFVSENLNAKVDWDGATETITISYNLSGNASGEHGGTKDQIGDAVIGTWCTTNSSLKMAIVITFNTDGTFRQDLAICSSISNYAEVTNGKYKLDGGSVTYYDQTYASAKGYWKSSGLPDYQELTTLFIEGDLKADDRTETIGLNDNDHLLLGGVEYTRFNG